MHNLKYAPSQKKGLSDNQFFDTPPIPNFVNRIVSGSSNNVVVMYIPPTYFQQEDLWNPEEERKGCQVIVFLLALN